MSSVLGHVRWQDVVDVLVLATVLFRVYTWLRGTVALQILLGMLVLVGAAFATSALGLRLTAYVLQALGAVATLVVVVVFRDEIRRALRRVDPLHFWRQRRDRSEPTGSAARLADAVFALAAHKLGGLFVVPGREPWAEHVASGIRLDAALGPELALAIFHATSPIHDGAAVVDGDRLTLAGAFLPLSAAAEIPDHLGTRHRAALGLSEHCDARVVVVSEERGEVSLARAGKLEPIASREALVRALAGGDAAAPIRRPRGARRADLAGFAVILVGVAIAWYVVVGGPGSEVIRTASVELREVPDGVELEPPRPSEVTVHLRGPRALLGELDEAELHAWIEVGDAVAGRRKVLAEAPAGIEILRIEPATVTIHRRGR